MKSARTYWRVTALAAIAVGAVVVAGCNGSPTAPSGAAVYSQTDLRVGTGADAITGSSITVNYIGWFYDASQANQKGVQFDTSGGGAGLTFTLGAGAVIAGWERGVVGMKEGGLRRLVIPPSLAYGSYRYRSIPPNATLVFEIELLTVK